MFDSVRSIFPESGTEEEASSTSEPQEPLETTTLTEDQMWTILRNPRRRRVIKTVAELDVDPPETVSLRELSEQIAQQADDVEVEEDGTVPVDARKRTYVSLYQCHLPKLSEVGAIAYDDRSGSVAPTENTLGLALAALELQRFCEDDE